MEREILKKYAKEIKELLDIIYKNELLSAEKEFKFNNISIKITDFDYNCHIIIAEHNEINNEVNEIKTNILFNDFVKKEKLNNIINPSGAE